MMVVVVVMLVVRMRWKDGMEGEVFIKGVEGEIV